MSRLGDGTVNEHLTPFKLMDGVSDVIFAQSYGYAIKTDSSLWGWGLNSGFLGDGTETDRSTPVKLMDNVSYVSSSYASACTYAIKTDGSLWSWGNNGYGRLGDGTETKRLSPVKILNNVVSISETDTNCFAVLTDGSLWAWGFNSWGNLGDGTTINRLSPVKIMEGVADILAIESYSMAIKTDGSLWTWNETPVKMLDGVKMSSNSQPALTATPTASTVLVNGKNIAFDAYNINGNNYFKLRDLAYILSGTQKQFDVGWDGTKNAISLTSGKAYTVAGGEMTGKGAGNKTPTPTSSKIYLDGKEVTFTAYNIDGNNYFKLRDIGEAFNFGVDWDAKNNTIVIDTGKGYGEEKTANNSNAGKSFSFTGLLNGEDAGTNVEATMEVISSTEAIFSYVLPKSAGDEDYVMCQFNFSKRFDNNTKIESVSFVLVRINGSTTSSINNSIFLPAKEGQLAESSRKLDAAFSDIVINTKDGILGFRVKLLGDPNEFNFDKVGGEFSLGTAAARR